MLEMIKNKSQKNFGQRNLGPKNLGPKKFRSQKFSSKNLGLKNWSQKFGSKKFRSIKFGSKKLVLISKEIKRFKSPAASRHRKVLYLKVFRAFKFLSDKCQQSKTGVQNGARPVEGQQQKKALLLSPNSFSVPKI